ncbi:sterol desaturase family protein [Marinomonas sp. 15G1-11]|uniref:Sterol desaturase family protein n=1 Tax=Marinomonas phaeophyticola TaxID=3004091 RepID=A0ABT4JY47_9GAMM|nr:sterol desaturase family protein [Marinomonas sp. 15G1-11]MCZ2722703.1 sterol desaturase family protein [Marinomonas sp. 15G1-11]
MYLLSAMAFASTFYACKYGKKGLKRSFQWLSPHIWWHPSSRQDYVLWIVNKCILSIFAPALFSQAAIATWIYYQSLNWTYIVSPIELDTSWVIALFTLSFFIVDDFSRFIVHWLMHRSSILWSFHQVHHSAVTMTPFTVFRTHPVEGLLFTLRSALAQGAVIGVFAAFFPQQISLFTVFGVLISTYIFNLLGANLRHSTLPISYGKTIEAFFISPAQHQLHHSLNPIHFDCNFGVTLAVWDRLFGTLQFGHDHQELQFGITGKIQYNSVFTLYSQPFYLAWRIIKKNVISLKKGP